MTIRILIAISFLTLCVTFAIAMKTTAKADFQAGRDAYNRQDYQTAFKVWLQLAEREGEVRGHENARAAVEIGKLYFEGKGVERDYAEALKWSHKAQKLGDGDSAQIVGRIYGEIQNESLTDTEAGRLYPTALKQRQDLEGKAEQGDAQAQLKVAQFYGPNKWNNFNGLRDDLKSARYYNMAAEQGSADAERGICFLFSESRSAGEMNGKPEVIKQYAETAANWCRKAAEAGDGESQRNLGLMYTEGWGLPADRKEALKWYLKAADQRPEMADLKTKAEKGDADAQFALGTFYGCIRGSLGADETLEWWRKSAEQGNWRAQLALGATLYAGGIDRDREEAYFWDGVALKLSAASAASPTGAIMPRADALGGTGQAKKHAAEYLSVEQTSAIEKRIDEWKPTLTPGATYNPMPPKAPDWVKSEGRGCTTY